MKLLFVLDIVDHPYAANPQLARRVMAELAGLGHTVHLLELTGGPGTSPWAPGPGRTFRLSFADEALMNRCLENGNKAGSPIWKRLARLCRHPAAALAAVRTLILHRSRRRCACKKELERLDGAQRYDAVIAVAAPYEATFALADARLLTRKISWQMDPYSIDHPHDASPAREQALYSALDRLFITQLMAQQAQRPGSALFTARDKTQVLDFPSLVPVPVPGSTPAGPLRCAFVGTLYPEIRTPHYALALFTALGLPDVTLTFAGGGWQHYPSQVEGQAKAALGERLEILGPLPPEQAHALLSSAQVLLYLGNGNADQLPSKLFEYFGSGKPVLALLKRGDDPALPYFQRYPLACIVLESEGVGAQVCSRVRAFFANSARQTLPYEQVERLYPQNSPRAVALALARGIEAAKTESDEGGAHS